MKLTTKNKQTHSVLRLATVADVSRLTLIEEECFEYDRISLRSFKHFMTSSTAVLIVLEAALAAEPSNVQGYGLLLLHRGTSLARIYSIAVHPTAGNQGFGHLLLDQLEQIALKRDKLFIRLEVAEKNLTALHVYRKQGYVTNAHIPDYYAEGIHGLRMEKKLLRKVTRPKNCPYVPQSTEFTCGPAALLMAMKFLNSKVKTSLIAELSIWREATTIFMASGHGGTSPLGLSLAAHNRHFYTELYISGEKIPFISTMRTPEKKAIYEEVHRDFERRYKEKKMIKKNTTPTIEILEEKYSQGATSIVLISTYQLDREKTPHWVWVVKIDENYVYINDPYVHDEDHSSMDDTIFIPVPRETFKKMMKYGTKKLAAAIFLFKQNM